MWFLALRHLTSKKGQTVLTLMGIILGTTAYIAISGLMLGFQTFIIDQLVNNDSHVRISAREEMLTERSLDKIFYPTSMVSWIKPPSGRKDNPYILSPAAWTMRLEADPHVAAVSPQILLQVIASHAKANTSARMIGSDPEKQKVVTNIEKYMVKGKFSDIGTSGNRIIIGDVLLNKMGGAINETILLSSGASSPEPFRIVGIFHLGVKSLDETTIFASLHDAQKLNKTPSRITDIAIRLNDVRDASAMASTWNLLGQEKVQSWDQSNAGIMSVFSMQDIVRNSMTISILVVAGFGIYNILSLAVSHKRREIAILRSMGYVPNDISLLFLIQGIILGLIGGILGSILGYLVCNYLSTIRVSSDRGIGGDRMMISFAFTIYIKGFLLAFLSSIIASVIPARSASKLDPIDIIRSENS